MKRRARFNGFKVISGVMVIGIMIGGIGGYALAVVKGPADMKGVTVTELGIINEESLKAQVGIEGFILRMRAVTVEPGGISWNTATKPVPP